MKKIHCFIACAFGRDNIDDLYEKAIIPALTALNIVGLRVDKINHNEKIDKQILNLINKSDFGIADLTYARPSVYFEAGFIEGQNKPVIYLAQKDHFIQTPDDFYGNFKIHFDLITKNIISWDKMSTKLITDIKKRVQLVTEPIRKRIETSEHLTISRNKFNLLSIDARTIKLKNLVVSFVRQNFNKTHYHENRSHLISLITTYDNFEYFITFVINDFISKNDIEFFSPKGLNWTFLGNHSYIRKLPNKIVYFTSLRTLRLATLDSVLKSCYKRTNKLYVNSIENETIQYFIIDNVNSEIEFKNQLKDSIIEIKNCS